MSVIAHTTDRSTLPGASASAEEQAKLVLYKNLASNLELQKAYIYVQITPSTTMVSPMLMGHWTEYGGPMVVQTGAYDAGNPDPDKGWIYSAPANVNPYYTGIGTSRTVNVLAAMDKITGYTIARNRYKFRIDLETVVIEQDSKNWTNIRDLSVIPIEVNSIPHNVLRRSYEVKEVLNAVPTVQGAKQDFELLYFQEARKETVPSPLFIRIPELANGNEPFHFQAQPSGLVSLLAGGQPLIIDDLARNPSITLEFGHMIFRGTDTEYAGRVRREVDPNDVDGGIFQGEATNGSVVDNIHRYDDAVYLDYNQEWFNREPIRNPAAPLDGNNSRFVIPSNRRQSDYVQLSTFDPEIPVIPGPVPEGDENPNEVNIRLKPLFTNQQASKIVMRLSITPIFMF